MSSLELPVRSRLLFQNDSGSEEEGEKMEVESFVTHVSVPSQKEVEDMLVRRKKRVRPCRGCTLALFILSLMPSPQNWFIRLFVLTRGLGLGVRVVYIPMLNRLHTHSYSL